MRCHAIIVASGSSRRMGFDKLAAPLEGLPVLRRSLDAFLRCDAIDGVVLVCPRERFEALAPGESAKPLLRVDGGAERQDSVRAGLAALPAEAELVAVHDGARPLVRDEAIRETVAAARHWGAASLARPVADTLKRADADGCSAAAVDRAGLWFMETPQVCRRDWLEEAHRAVARGGLTVTDEVSALQAAGHRSRFVESRFPNLKITRPSDLVLAAALLRNDEAGLPDPS